MSDPKDREAAKSWAKKSCAVSGWCSECEDELTDLLSAARREGAEGERATNEALLASIVPERDALREALFDLLPYVEIAPIAPSSVGSGWWATVRPKIHKARAALRANAEGGR